MFKKISKFIAGLVVAFAFFAASSPTGASAASCPDVQFVFARGSGETIGDISAVAWQSALENKLADTNLTYNFYELGSTAYGDAQYPAVAIGLGSLTNFGTILGAVVSGGESYTFGESVAQGSLELSTFIQSTIIACPNTKFILGGYSQGAMVISKTLPSLNSDQILYAATFGDPKLYLPEGQSVATGGTDPIPVACYGKNLSPYRIHVPDCRAYEGILGGYQPYTTANFKTKLGTWCNGNDIMCSSKFSLNDHTSYASDNLYQLAAATIFQKLKAAFPEKITSTATAATHNTAILIDTTGSMSGLINTYKNEALNLAKKVLDSGGKVALYEYRDLADPFYTVQHCDFTCSYTEFAEKLSALKTDGGGDTQESVLSASLTVMNTLKWQKGATKSIVLLTDAGYLPTDRDGTTLADVKKRSLEIDPVNIYAVTSVPSEYKELTTVTNGAVFNIGKDEITLSTRTVLERPTAILPFESYSGTVGDTFTFDASASTAEATIDHYEWDLDCDGIFEQSTFEPSITKTYFSEISGFIQVKVVDENDLSSTMSATLEVSAVPLFSIVETPATLTNLQLTKLNDTEFVLTFEKSKNTAKILVILNDVILGYTTETFLHLTNIPENSHLRLLPISTSNTRGTALDFSLDASMNSKPIVSASSDSTLITFTPTIKAPNSGQK